MQVKIPPSTKKHSGHKAFRSLWTFAVPFFLLLVAIIFRWFTSLPNIEKYHQDIASAIAIKSKHSMMTGPLIEYTKIESRDEVILYAASYVEDSTRKPLSIGRWAELLSGDDDKYSNGMAADISKILKDSPFTAFRFETKGCNKANLHTKQFEFVLVNDPHLSTFAEYADIASFSEHFSVDDSQPAVVFDNLGHNAVLIAPQPISREYVRQIYGHCANFVRLASQDQIAGTWRMVAKAFLLRINERNGESVWFSTAGTGIRWLHFRLDDRPKYYNYRAFAKET